MAGEKTVVISVEDEGITKELKFLRVTEAKISEELDSDIVKTFDEPVTVPSSDGGYTVDISALEARSVDDFFTLKQILQKMKTVSGSITISETVKYKGTSFENEHHLGSVTLTSNEVTYNAEDLTARELSFNAETLTEYVNGNEVKWG